MVIDMHTASLDLHTRVDETRTTLYVAGELDAHSADELRVAVRRVLEIGPAWLRLDLSTVGFVDSTGLGVLVGARKAARAAAVPFDIATSPRLTALLRRTGLLGFFDLI